MNKQPGSVGYNPLDRGAKEYDPVADPEVTVIPKTPGGDTYYLKSPGRQAGPKCWRLKRKRYRYRGKERCLRAAGWGTSHAGTGACRFHGGAVIKGPEEKLIRKGYGQFLTDKYAARFDTFRTMEEPKSLLSELALLRVLLSRVLEREEWDTKEVRDTLEAVGRMVDRMDRLDMAFALTQAQVQLLVVHMVALINRHITEQESRVAFATEFLGVFGLSPDDQGQLTSGSVSDNRVLELAKTRYGMEL